MDTSNEDSQPARKKQAIRSAESDRVSSCAFADLVAELSIAHFRTYCETKWQESYEQTVLAAILVQEGNEVPVVVSVGVGTKILPLCLLQEDEDGRRVHDCHAEVLARRGFIRYIYSQINRYFERQKSIFVAATSDATLLQLQDSISIHFYTSSQPCGNASIKRWGKNRTPITDTTLATIAPSYPHPKYYPTAIPQGEIALLCKRSINDVAECTTSDIPAGLCSAHSACGVLMSCSDKIAKWNALGVQGSSLLQFLAEPIYITSLTIGRKCSIRHAQRALCCRLSSFQRSIFQIHHPNIYCTAVKFDTSAIDTSKINVTHAKFNEARCVFWCDDNNTSSYCSIDSGTGLAEDGSRSSICGAALRDLYFQTRNVVPVAAIIANTAPHNFYMHRKATDLRMSLNDLTMQLREYCAAKDELFSQKKYFSEWVKYKQCRSSADTTGDNS